MKSSIKRELIDIPFRSCSDTVSEWYRSNSPTPTLCLNGIGAPLRLRHCVGMVSEHLSDSDSAPTRCRSTSPTPILCRSRVGPTPFCSDTSPTPLRWRLHVPTSFRHRGSVVKLQHVDTHTAVFAHVASRLATTHYHRSLQTAQVWVKISKN